MTGGAVDGTGVGCGIAGILLQVLNAVDTAGGVIDVAFSTVEGVVMFVLVAGDHWHGVVSTAGTVVAMAGQA